MLQAYVSDIPLASEMKLNVQLCGYDFTLLESYQSFVHSLCENMGVDVEEWYGFKLINLLDFLYTD